MKKTTAISLLTLAFICCSQMSLVFAEKAPDSIYSLAETTLVALGTDSVLIKAVKDENSKGKTLDQIKIIDDKWKQTPGIADYMKAIMENDCAKRLNEIVAADAYYAEIFVMDNQGANVCMSDKTSDYWQGDEGKFQKSFNEGNGALFVDEVEFDESTQSYLVQISLPVKDGEVVIGAITFGIDIDIYEENSK